MSFQAGSLQQSILLLRQARQWERWINPVSYFTAILSSSPAFNKATRLESSQIVEVLV